MEWWESVRRRVLVEGTSKRQVMRETGIHWETLKKVLAFSSPPGYRFVKPRGEPKIGPFRDRIREILEDDKTAPRKQRHTAKRIFERLREEGYTGGYTQVKKVVRETKTRTREVFVPLVHRAGEAQVDFGHAVVKENGRLHQVVFFVMVLPYSDAFFMQVFDSECTEVWQEAHRRAFEHFGGVPWRITYDNAKPLAAKIIGPRERELTRGFLALRSHYLFDTHFCLVRRANEKGVVEGIVRYGRSNFLVPVPQVRSLEELNATLVELCQRDRSRRLRGKRVPKAVLLEEERDTFRELPAAPFDACRKVSTAANSLSLVRFERNDYSVPVRYAHHPVVVKGYVDRVEISYKGDVVARHRRLWGKEEVLFEPVHYLALLERKPGAFDHARPVDGWDLPECFPILRRRMESEFGGKGTREYIRTLRLLEKHTLRRLTRAVEKALEIGALTRDAVAQFLFPREEWRETTFRLDGREHLRHVRVSSTDVSAYSGLLAAGGDS